MGMVSALLPLSLNNLFGSPWPSASTTIFDSFRFERCISIASLEPDADEEYCPTFSPGWKGHCCDDAAAFASRDCLTMFLVTSRTWRLWFCCFSGSSFAPGVDCSPAALRLCYCLSFIAANWLCGELLLSELCELLRYMPSEFRMELEFCDVLRCFFTFLTWRKNSSFTTSSSCEILVPKMDVFKLLDLRGSREAVAMRRSEEALAAVWSSSYSPVLFSSARDVFDISYCKVVCWWIF